MRRKAAILIGSLLCGFFSLSTSASAAPDDPPAGCTYEIGDWYGRACFMPVDDKTWVYDPVRNDWNVRAQVETDYPADGLPRKTRWCAPASSVEIVELWLACNYDHREDRCVRMRIYEQFWSDTRTRNWSTWSDWLHVDSGFPC